MTTYVTIPEVTEAENLESFQWESEGKSVTITMSGSTNTAVQLMQGAANGTVYPLVVIATDGMTVALDNVVFTSASFSGAGNPDDPLAVFTLDAQEVRYI